MNKNKTRSRAESYDRDNDRDYIRSPYNTKDAFLYNPVSSATDCTGYVQRIPWLEGEAESYAELYDVPVASYDGEDAAPPAR